MNWLPIVLLAALSLVFALFFLFRRSNTDNADAEQISAQLNTELYQERIAEIQQLLSENEIDQQQADQQTLEQQRLLLQDTPVEVASPGNNGPTVNATVSRWSVVLLLVLAPLVGFALYQQLGALADLEITALLEQQAEAESAEATALITDKLISKVEQRLAADPENAGYRVMLARLFLETRQFEDSVRHYQQAARILENQPEIQAEYAQAAYMLAEGQFTPAVMAAIARTLTLDPGNVTALGLQGVKAFEDQDYPKAISSWQMALGRLPGQSQQAVILSTGIQRAKLAMGDALPGVTVELSLATELKAQPDQVIYVFARQWQGPPLPLAVARFKVADLPLSLKLDDTMVMPGGRPLSSATEIEVIARVSSSGSVAPQPGDLEGRSGQIQLQNGALEQPVLLKIDTRLP